MGSSLGISIASVVAAFIVGGILIAGVGISPLRAYGSLFDGAFGSAYSFGDSLVKMTPLIFTGLAVAFARRCGMLSIGAEGQLYAGAVSATAVALLLAKSPPWVVQPLAVLAGFIGGGLLGAIPGWLRAKLGVSEIINTIMLNYIAMYFTTYLLNTSLQEPEGMFPQSPELDLVARLPRLIQGTRLHLGFILALVVAYLVYLVLWKTALGYQIRVVGLNMEAARYGGIDVGSSMVVAMFISGGLAGLGGAVEILGVHHRLIDGFAGGVGFNGIAVALLGQSTPQGVIASAFLFGALRTGAMQMQRSHGVSATIISVIQGVVVLFVVAAGNLRYIAHRFKGLLPRIPAAGHRRDAA
jgi:simple sugar transport system permease protein